MNTTLLKAAKCVEAEDKRFILRRLQTWGNQPQQKVRVKHRAKTRESSETHIPNGEPSQSSALPCSQEGQPQSVSLSKEISDIIVLKSSR